MSQLAFSKETNGTVDQICERVTEGIKKIEAHNLRHCTRPTIS